MVVFGKRRAAAVALMVAGVTIYTVGGTTVLRVVGIVAVVVGFCLTLLHTPQVEARLFDAEGLTAEQYEWLGGWIEFFKDNPWDYPWWCDSVREWLDDTGWGPPPEVPEG